MGIKTYIIDSVRRSTWLSYGKKKSIIKRLLPQIRSDFPFETDFFGLRYQGNAADHIDRSVFLCGAYEKHVLYFMRDAVDKLGYHDDAFVDVGANTGNHALFMSRIMKQVVAFEPFEPVCLELQAKIHANAVDNIEVLPFGLGVTTADMPFSVPDRGNKGTGSFNPAFRPSSRAVTLPLVRGDEFFESRNDRIKLIKIDVEGFEYSVLQGLRSTLRRYRPILVFEMSTATLDAFANDESFRSAFPDNYRWYCFKQGNKSSGAYRLQPYRFGAALRCQDVVAAPAESADSIPVNGPP